MAYQPLYATCTDNQVGDGHTSSLRGRVTRVWTDVNTFNGIAIKTGSGYIDGEEQVSKPDLRRVPKGAEREKVKQAYKDEVRRKTGYWHDIDLSVKLDNHDFSINGYKLTDADKEAINDGVFNELPDEIKEKGVFALLDEIIAMKQRQKEYLLKLLGV